MSKIETVGVIGLGAIGLPMAGHLHRHGLATYGFDVAEAPLRAAREAGIATAESPKALASQCDLVIALPAFEAQVEAVLFGADGVAAGARPGTVVAVGATVSPHAMARFGRRLVEHGLLPLDIPICRGVEAAKEGKLLITGGGDPDTFERCRPVFAAFADAIHHLGGVGAGQVGKMVNNLILWACISANEEGFALGARLGVDREALRAMLLQSSAGNWAMATRAEERGATWAEKDMMIVLDEADRARLSMPMSAVVKEVIKAVKIARGSPMQGAA